MLAQAQAGQILAEQDPAATAAAFRRIEQTGKQALVAGYPPGTRIIVRRERPHPGAQLDLFDTMSTKPALVVSV